MFARVPKTTSRSGSSSDNNRTVEMKWNAEVVDCFVFFVRYGVDRSYSRVDEKMRMGR